MFAVGSLIYIYILHTPNVRAKRIYIFGYEVRVRQHQRSILRKAKTMMAKTLQFVRTRLDTLAGNPEYADLVLVIIKHAGVWADIS